MTQTNMEVNENEEAGLVLCTPYSFFPNSVTPIALIKRYKQTKQNK